MKRSTYRKEVKKYLRDKQKEKKRGTPQDKTSYTQKTTEFSRVEFKENNRLGEDIDRLDTNEIFFERQRERQWLWSSPKHSNQRIIACVMIVVAIILISYFTPTLWRWVKDFFMFHIQTI